MQVEFPWQPKATVEDYLRKRGGTAWHGIAAEVASRAQGDHVRGSGKAAPGGSVETLRRIDDLQPSEWFREKSLPKSLRHA